MLYRFNPIEESGFCFYSDLYHKEVELYAYQFDPNAKYITIQNMVTLLL